MADGEPRMPSARRLAFDPQRCLACRSCELACAVIHSRSGTLPGAIAEETAPRRRVSLVAGEAGLEARRCDQCDEPLCAFSCKSGALARDPRSGRVAFAAERCLGCYMCLMVCPHGVRPDPATDRVVRCDVCDGLARPACVVACPTRALWLEEAAPRRPTGDFAGHVVVVGSSAAGLAACEAARELAPGCRITLVTADERPRVSRPLLAYALAGKIPREALDWRPAEHLAALDVELRQARAVGLRPAARGGALRLEDGADLAYDRLVIATGARAARLGVPGEDLPGACPLRDLEDLARIEELLRRRGGRARVVVLGGGNVGLQVCEALAQRGAPVTVVVASPHLLSQMVDSEAGRRVGELFARHGVTVRTACDARQIVGDGRVEAVHLASGELLPAELVVVGKGITPNVEWLSGSGVRLGRAIVVDRCGRTNVPDVLAAGDCTETVDPLTGQTATSGIWPVAYEGGRAAGAAAVGVERPAAGALRMNASRFFATPIISIGEVRDGRLAGATARVLASDAGAYRKLVWRGARLVGALLYGDVRGAGLFYRLYRAGTEIAGGGELGDDASALRLLGGQLARDKREGDLASER